MASLPGMPRGGWVMARWRWGWWCRATTAGPSTSPTSEATSPSRRPVPRFFPAMVVSVSTRRNPGRSRAWAAPELRVMPAAAKICFPSTAPRQTSWLPRMASTGNPGSDSNLAAVSHSSTLPWSVMSPLATMSCAPHAVNSATAACRQRSGGGAPSAPSSGCTTMGKRPKRGSPRWMSLTVAKRNNSRPGGGARVRTGPSQRVGPSPGSTSRSRSPPGVRPVSRAAPGPPSSPTTAVASPTRTRRGPSASGPQVSWAVVSSTAKTESGVALSVPISPASRPTSPPPDRPPAPAGRR